MRLSPSEEQQHEMRHAYYDGAPGIFVSGIVWLAAALGRPIFWAFGVSLIVAANLALFSEVPPALAAGIGGTVEVLFAFLVFSSASKATV